MRRTSHQEPPGDCCRAGSCWALSLPDLAGNLRLHKLTRGLQTHLSAHP